jgi:hypothetical protein
VQDLGLTYEEDRRLSRIRQELARDNAPAKAVDPDQQSHGMGHDAGKLDSHPIRERNRKNRPLEKGGVGVSIPIPILEGCPDGLVPLLDGKTVCRPGRRPPVPAVRVGKMVSWAWVNDPAQGWVIVQDAPADRRYDPVMMYARERTLQAKHTSKAKRSTANRDGYRRRQERKAHLREMVGRSA